MSRVNEVPMPDRIAKLPQYKGIPITAITEIDDNGVPNFKLVNTEKVWHFKKNKCCSICGESLDYWIAFMVTKPEIDSRFIFESPNHEECLRYAFAVCPWLYYSKASYTNLDTIKVADGVKVIASHPDRKVMSERPDMLAMYICRSYENVIHKGMRVCKAAPPKRIEWFEGH